MIPHAKPHRTSLLGTAAVFVFLAAAALCPQPAFSQLPGSQYVIITNPANGAIVSGDVIVHVAMQYGGTTAGVQFQLDGANLGAEDTVSPYQISWDTRTTTNGSHTLVAIARDHLGVRYHSDPVVVTVENDLTAPEVALTSPAPGSTLTGTISVDANASDNVGVIGVQFQLDGANLAAEDTTAPYSVSWDTRTASAGPHSLRAIARDAAGNWTASTAVNVTVADQTPPSVNITSPSGGSTVSGTIDVTADASDNVGVAGIQFQLNGVNLGAEDVTAPYSVSWDTGSISNGGHSLTAIARDAAGNTSTSPVVSVTVANDIAAPSVAITSPISGATVEGTISVAADATDNVEVAGVQFYVDGTPVGTEDLTAPYSVSWDTRTSPNRGHSLTAIARDAAGNSTTSEAVSVTVSNDVTPPTVTIVSPANNKTVWGTITVSASATDDRSVAGVQFYVDGAAEGPEDTAPPYEATWDTRTVANGAHTLTASARDSAGNSSISSPVTVNVANSSVGASGDLMVGFMDGRVQWHAPDGTLRKIMVGVSDGESSGLAFDHHGILYVPHWYSRTVPNNGNTVVRFDIDGNLLGEWGSGYNCNPSSLAFDATGNVYVGQEGCAADILKIDPAGNLVASFDAQVGIRGPDHIDLAPDGCTIFYTNWGKDVLRYNVCTNTQMTNFNVSPLPGETAWHLRILPDGGVIVTDSEYIVRLDTAGNQIQTYRLNEPNANWWVGVDILPDGTFWAISTVSGEVVKWDLETGAVLSRFSTGAAPYTAVGVAIKP